MSIYFANLLSLSILSYFIFNRWSRSKSLIEPGIVFALNLIALYPILGLVLYYFGDSSQPDYPGISIAENIENVSWLSVLGCFGFCFGYAVFIGRRKLLILDGVRRADHADDVLVVFFFFLAALLGIGYKIATGDYISFLMSESRISGLSQVGSMLTALQWPAFIGAWVLWFRGWRSQGFLVLFVCVQCIVIPYQFIQGSKTFISLLMLSVILAYYWTKGKLPKLSILTSVAIVILFVFPYVQNFRENVRVIYGGIPSFTELDVSQLKSRRIDDKAEQETSLESLLKVSARYGGIDHLYGIMQTVPDFMPYRYGIEYSAVLVNFVPRAVWPDKPIFSRGADYGAALGTVTSVTPFPFGEAYWDMGEPGLFVMMFLWGTCLAIIVRGYAFFYQRPGLPFFIGLYFLSRIYWMAGGESSMPTVIAGLPQELALLWLLYVGLKLVKRKSTKQRLRGAMRQK